jgi:ferritin-like metal-binding protein YciE
MSQPESLQDMYVDELKDLWSANDQMARVLKKIGRKATNETLRQLLSEAPEGIAEHTKLLKTLVQNQGEKVSKEHCKGMEGLCAEAIKHTVEEAPDKGPLLDVAIITQFQRMSHYGLAGFGTAAALARSLGLDDDAQQLSDAVAEIYDTDEIMSEIGEEAVNEDAASEGDEDA